MPLPAPPYVATSYHAELYEQVTPLAYDDSNQAWALYNYLAAIASMFDQIEKYARDSDQIGRPGLVGYTPSRPGWSILLDIDRCPLEALPWLGQFVGVQVNTTLSEADQRTQIRNVGNLQRGTAQAIHDAVALTLTGTRTVNVVERVGGNAYALQVSVRSSECPSIAVSTAAALSQKPAGLFPFTFTSTATVTYGEMETIRYPGSYTVAENAFATYADAEALI